MKYSFVIPTHNSKQTIQECIVSIEKQNCEKEVIVVDDNSTDNTCNIIQDKFNWIKIYFVNFESAAKTRNYGANKTKYDNIVFVDSDIILEKDWINKMSSHLKTCDMVIGGMEKTREMNLNILNFRPAENFTLIKKDIFNKVNGYRECYKKSGGEDVDLLLRILKREYKVFYQKVNFVHVAKNDFKKINPVSIFCYDNTVNKANCS